VRLVRHGATATERSADWFVLQELGGRSDGGVRDASGLLE
jgi:hypothetical protein